MDDPIIIIGTLDVDTVIIIDTGEDNDLDRYCWHINIVVLFFIYSCFFIRRYSSRRGNINIMWYIFSCRYTIIYILSYTFRRNGYCPYTSKA